MKKTAIITGSSGGIGSALCKIFKDADFNIVGIDKEGGTDSNQDHFLSFDLSQLSYDKTYRLEQLSRLNEFAQNTYVLINNAAIQILDSSMDIQLDQWNETLSVNLTTPFILSQWAIPYLRKNKGSIINIASIHHQLTKPEFVAYATSKSALVGLTKSMAVDLAGSVRVNAISPAAIETDMLRASFENDKNKLEQLKAVHPVQRIGRPEEVAKLALCLSSGDLDFVNGTNLAIDGGISSVLRDID